MSPDRICIAGLRECEYPYIEKRVDDWGLTHFSPVELSTDSKLVTDWLRNIGASKVMIHFDMDVMNHLIFLQPLPMDLPVVWKLNEAMRLINDIAAVKELVALTIAEPMPRLAIRLKAMLANLPLMK